MRKNMTIRAKITVANIILLVIASNFLSIKSKSSAGELLNLIPIGYNFEAIKPMIPLNESIFRNEEIQPQIPLETIKAATITYSSSINFSVIVVILLGGAATYLTMKRLLKPLEDLEIQIEQINVDNLSKNIELPKCDDEIQRITEKFNKMTDKLKDSFDVQKRFSQNAAHELRTPLTVIRTKLDVFKKSKNRTQSEYDALIESMIEQTDRLSNVVESLLNLTNFNEISYTSDIRLDKTTKKVLIDLDEYIKEKNITVICEEVPVSIKGNEPLMYRCIFNLIENAIMYNKQNGYIRILFNQTATQTFIIIKDSGIGIPKDLKHDIFEPFFRVDKSRSRKLGGSGLGLSIVKEILQKHNGDIEVYDNQPSGVIFKIKINTETKRV